MKFLLDVHIGLRIARALSEEGHDVLRAALAMPTASDTELLNLAIAEERIVITEDSDFNDLIFARGHPPPPSLIYVRCEPFEQVEISQRIGEIVAGAELIGRIVVVTAKQARYRSFPKGKS